MVGCVAGRKKIERRALCSRQSSASTCGSASSNWRGATYGSRPVRSPAPWPLGAGIGGLTSTWPSASPRASTSVPSSAPPGRCRPRRSRALPPSSGSVGSTSCMHTLALACLRLGEDAREGRGADRLPSTVTDPLADTLVRSLGEPELRRALAAATRGLLGELEAWDPSLCARLSPLLHEFGAPQAQASRPGSPNVLAEQKE